MVYSRPADKRPRPQGIETTKLRRQNDVLYSSISALFEGSLLLSEILLDFSPLGMSPAVDVDRQLEVAQRVAEGPRDKQPGRLVVNRQIVEATLC